MKLKLPSNKSTKELEKALSIASNIEFDVLSLQKFHNDKFHNNSSSPHNYAAITILNEHLTPVLKQYQRLIQGMIKTEQTNLLIEKGMP